MTLGDVICNTSTNQLNLQGYNTTCGGTTGSCSGTAGPCGKFTDANGQFPETLTVCAPACKPAGGRPLAWYRSPECHAINESNASKEDL